jgi:hypothetical protein
LSRSFSREVIMAAAIAEAMWNTRRPLPA